MHSYCAFTLIGCKDTKRWLLVEIQAPVKATLCILVFPPGWLWNSFFMIHWLVTGRRGTPAIDTVRPAEQAQDYSIWLRLPARHTSHKHRHLSCSREMPARSLFSALWAGAGEEGRRMRFVLMRWCWAGNQSYTVLHQSRQCWRQDVVLLIILDMIVKSFQGRKTNKHTIDLALI